MRYEKSLHDNRTTINYCTKAVQSMKPDETLSGIPNKLNFNIAAEKA